jgi:hypothetical protein
MYFTVTHSSSCDGGALQVHAAIETSGSKLVRGLCVFQEAQSGAEKQHANVQLVTSLDVHAYVSMLEHSLG